MRPLRFLVRCVVAAAWTAVFTTLLVIAVGVLIGLYVSLVSYAVAEKGSFLTGYLLANNAASVITEKLALWLTLAGAVLVFAFYRLGILPGLRKA